MINMNVLQRHFMSFHNLVFHVFQNSAWYEILQHDVSWQHLTWQFKVWLKDNTFTWHIWSDISQQEISLHDIFIFTFLGIFGLSVPVQIKGIHW